MNVRDQERLNELLLTQAELARILQTSRQAINAGIKKQDDYLNANRMQMIHRHFVKTRDYRQELTARILLEEFEQKPCDAVGVSDVLGLELNENRIKLILGNQFLREHLKEIISQIVETKCQEFESIFANKKAPE